MSKKQTSFNENQLFEIEFDLLLKSTHFIRPEIEDHYRKFMV